MAINKQNKQNKQDTGNIHHNTKNKSQVSQRQLRIASEIQNIVANMILLNEIYHQDLKNTEITISYVNVSRDLKLCNIYIITRESAYRDKAVQILNTLCKSIAHILIQKIKLKYAPQIIFHPDTNWDRMNKIDQLLKNYK